MYIYLITFLRNNFKRIMSVFLNFSRDESVVEINSIVNYSEFRKQVEIIMNWKDNYFKMRRRSI